MVVVGIDAGHMHTRTVVLSGGAIVGKACVPTDYDPGEASERSLAEALRRAGLSRDDICSVVSTGFGRAQVGIAGKTVTDYSAAAIVARSLVPTAAAVIDVGAEGIRVTRLGDDGSVVEFGVNDKCATGGGTFLQNMARVLAVPVEGLSDLASLHTQEIAMDTQCAVFAESEVISLVHSQTPVEDIAFAVQEALVGKICSIALRVGTSGDVVLTGASGANESLARSVGARLGISLHVPEDPAFAIAYGAALHAYRR